MYVIEAMYVEQGLGWCAYLPRASAQGTTQWSRIGGSGRESVAGGRNEMRSEDLWKSERELLESIVLSSARVPPLLLLMLSSHTLHSLDP
jgi:hypothetical protein